MKVGAFAIFTDGSNDNGLKKMLPLTISVLSVSSETGVSNEFLDICMSSRSTGEGQRYIIIYH